MVQQKTQVFLDFGFANVNGPHMKYELGMYQHLDICILNFSTTSKISKSVHGYMPVHPQLFVFLIDVHWYAGSWSLPHDFFYFSNYEWEMCFEEKNISRLTCALMHEKRDDTAVQNGCDT